MHVIMIEIAMMLSNAHVAAVFGYELDEIKQRILIVFVAPCFFIEYIPMARWNSYNITTIPI